MQRTKSVIPRVTLLLWLAGWGGGTVAQTPPGAVVVQVGDRVPEQLVLVNTMDEVMTVSRVESSCPCLQVVDAPRAVAPGETTEILLELTPDTPGSYRYEVQVHTSDPQHPVRRYFLDVDVPSGTEVLAADGGRDAVIGRMLGQMDTRRRDTGLYRDVEEVQRDLATGRPVLLVDVRPASAYDGTHIPGSLNIPLWELKVRRFLKAKDVLIVDEGFGRKACEEVCLALREAGFASVHILAGGIALWYRAGGTVAGTGHGRAALNRIDASDFMTSWEYGDWIVLGAGTDPTSRMLPERCRHLSGPGGARDVLAGKPRAGKGSEPLQRVLIIDSDGSNYPAYEQALLDAPHAVVFCLRDGQNGWEQQLKDVVAMHRRSRKVIRGPGDGSRAVLIRKTCSSCP